MRVNLQRKPRAVECTKSTGAARAPQANAYVQHTIAPGINSWVFDYWNDAAVEKRAVGCGLELAVQLDGDWYNEGHITGAKLFTRGMHFGVTAGERYRHSHKRARERGRQVGFVIFGDKLESFETPDRELRFTDVGECDARFTEFCRSFAECVERGLPPPADTSREVEAFVSRRFAWSAPSPAIQAKKELERNFQFDLSMELVTERAAIHEETFCRHFTRRYGISPAAYRVLYRLNHATRLLWSRPDMTIAEIAEECGFRNKSYFHRAYARQYETTPNAARSRFAAARLRAA